MDPLERLEDLGQFRMRLGLSRIRRLLNELGNPQTQIPSIHVAGTNGKGSTCHMVDSIFSGFPIRRSLYTSPHLIDVTERMVFNGETVDRKELSDTLSLLFEKSEDLFDRDDMPTYFEMLTAAFFYLSRKKETDLNIVEVGMGGRFDATNILEPMAVALTSISLDHTEHLGDEKYQIAREKAGIIKPSTPVIMGPIHQGGEGGSRALSSILDICTENGSPVVIIAESRDVEKMSSMMISRGIPDGRIVEIRDVAAGTGKVSAEMKVVKPFEEGPFEDLLFILDNVVTGRFKAPLQGRVQAYNMAAAVSLALLSLSGAYSHSRLRKGNFQAVEELIDGCSEPIMKEFETEEIKNRVIKGLSAVKIPGRMEYIPIGDLNVLFDGGHNAEASISLGRSISESHPGKRFPLLISMMQGKDPAAYARGICDVVSDVVITEIEDERSIPAERVASNVAGCFESGTDIHIRKSIDRAFEMWIKMAMENGIGISGGSFYLYAPLKERIKRPI